MRSLEKLSPLALLLLRLALGAIFIYHGYPKLFGHTREFMQAFVRMGFPGYFVYISGVIEFFCGCMLIAGLFTRVAGLLLAAEMAIGIWKAGHLIADPMAVLNYEPPPLLAVSAFTLATIGAGIISIDHALFHEGHSSPRKTKSKN